MLHRAVRNFSQDLQVKFRWMWIYWGYRWMLAHCNSDLGVHFITKQYITLWLGDIRNNKGEDCASNQDCASKESIWGGWYPSAEFSSHQQNNARYAHCCNTSKKDKEPVPKGQSGASSAEVTLNALNASESEVISTSVLGSLRVLILLLFKVDVESLADFGNGGQVR